MKHLKISFKQEFTYYVKLEIGKDISQEYADQLLKHDGYDLEMEDDGFDEFAGFANETNETDFSEIRDLKVKITL